ncbi:MAG: J domain-containing protein [Pseudomonadota bacterium]
MSPMLAMVAGVARVTEPVASSGPSTLLLVIVFAAFIGLALGMSWKWVVGATALYAIGNGNIIPVLAVLIVITLLREHRVRIRRFLEEHARGGEVFEAEWGARFRAHKRAKHAGTRGRRWKSKRKSRFDGGFRAGAETRNGTASSTATSGPGPEQLLGVGAGFTRRDLDQARRRAAKTCHPDLHLQASPDVQAKMADRMRAINDAYESLLPRAA